jgi:hypothetical protein
MSINKSARSSDSLGKNLFNVNKAEFEKMTVDQLKELIESTTDIFFKLSAPERSQHIQELLFHIQKLKMALPSETNPLSIKYINKQLRLFSDYQKQLEKKLGMPLLVYLSKYIVVADFDDADYGVAFAKYCEKNNIKRKDGKQIPWRGGMEPGIEYVDQE